MNNNIVIQSNSINYYLYNERCRFLFLLHPQLVDKLNSSCNNKNSTKKNDEYYLAKYKYLQHYGIINKENNDTAMFSFLSSGDIEKALTNTRQVIFEVTDKCNLNCFYCGYGKLYNNYDSRINKNMDFDIFISTMKYMYSKWHFGSSNRGNEKVRISFYGGEPLINFKFINDAVDFIKNNSCDGKEFIFSMTTNGMLIDNYIEFLVYHNFELLISIDGNEFNNSYRVDHSGKTVFSKLYHNIHLIKSKYPNYFKQYVKFNAVLHDRNTIEEIATFLYNEFDKIPQISELNMFGVRTDMKLLFNSMFNSKRNSQNMFSRASSMYSRLEKSSPVFIESSKFFNNTLVKQFNRSFQQFINTNSIFLENSKVSTTIPTGSCIPFSRKVFVTVTGKLYPCERIGNEYNFGCVTKSDVNINYMDIANTYNGVFKKYIQLCRKCKRVDTCPVCIMSDVKGYELCNNRYDESHIVHYLNDVISICEKNPSYYRCMINETNVI